jgi:hypothetical protein
MIPDRESEAISAAIIAQIDAPTQTPTGSTLSASDRFLAIRAAK